MNVFELRDRLVSDYRSYTRSFIKIRDPRIIEHVDHALSAGAFWPEPLLQLNPTFLPGGTIDDLTAAGTLHPECARIFHIDKSDSDHTGTILCEEIVPLACSGAADVPQWLAPEEGERLLAARPERNLIQTAIDQQLGLLLPALPKLQKSLGALAKERAAAQLGAHERVREASRTKGRVSIQPVLPVDILGAYVLLPMPGNGRAP